MAISLSHIWEYLTPMKRINLSDLVFLPVAGWLLFHALEDYGFRFLFVVVGVVAILVWWYKD